MDGKKDLAVGAPGEDVAGHEDQGRVYAYDGASGKLLFQLDSPLAEAKTGFGMAVAIGDVDGDGRGEVVVGSPLAGAGLVYAFSGLDGKLIRTLAMPNPQDGAQFGSSVSLFDVDGDGKVEFFIGAPREAVNGNKDQGRVYIFSSTGKFLRTLDIPIPQPGSLVGTEVGPCQHALVGAPGIGVGGRAGAGRAYLFDANTGKLLLTLTSPNPQAGAAFGQQACQGDFDGDGVLDAVIAAPLEDGGTGHDEGWVYGLSGTSGTPLFTLQSRIPQASGQFGASLFVEKDVAKGQIPRILVGTPGEKVGQKAGAGQVYLFGFGK